MKKNVLSAAIFIICLIGGMVRVPGLVLAEPTNLPQAGFERTASALSEEKGGAPGTTYYVRPDGGTSSQCTGLADAPYPGSGQGQACAWRHPFWALDGSGAWSISGGDTIVVGPGSYRMGFGADNTGWCEQWWSYDCHLPPLPSGPDQATPTGILGKGWDKGCPSPPELWGAERPWQVLSLAGSDHVVVRCLEITDHAGCVDSHSNGDVSCERENPPFGNHADYGIRAYDSEDVLLADLNIHGLSSGGVHAGRLRDWTLENVRIAGNGWVGWDGDLGVDSEGDPADSSNTGAMTFKNVTVEWNGCAETWPGESVNNCWAQTAGGYGDGLGTEATAGDWTFEDCVFRYNTSDGLDLLYHRLGGKITVKRSSFHSNAGNQAKFNGNTRIENSLIVGNCGWFAGKSFTYHVDNCRAAGNALSLTMLRGNSVSVVNSTVAGK